MNEDQTNPQEEKAEVEDRQLSMYDVMFGSEESTNPEPASVETEEEDTDVEELSAEEESDEVSEEEVEEEEVPEETPPSYSVKVDGEDLIILRESDILGIVEIKKKSKKAS